jgi:hypothetical protein
MITSQPQLIARLTTLLSERIWIVYRQLANTQIHDPLGRMYDMLQIQIEKKKVDINEATSFSFDFGVKELINMVGLPAADAPTIGRKFLENKAIQILNDKIFIKDAKEIGKQNAYYQKMEQIEKARMAGKK